MTRHEREKAARQIDTHTAAEWAEIRARANGCCQRCGDPCRRLMKDHIVPIYIPGSSDAASNLRAVCRSCNSSRGPVLYADTLAEEFRRVRDLRRESTREFAEHFGRSPRTIEDWEQGRRRPSMLERRELALLRANGNRKRNREIKRLAQAQQQPLSTD